MQYFCVILSLFYIVKCEGKFLVVGGKDAAITQFPHCAALNAMCRSNRVVVSWNCGASIINQWILITAAHCLIGCTSGSGSKMFVSVGHRNKIKGIKSSVQRSFAHNFSYFKPGQTLNDLALLQVKTRLTFNERVQRVALMKHPPYYEKAELAGWGLITDTIPKQDTIYLQSVDQYMWNRSMCKKFTGSVYTTGTLCASSGNESSHASSGDSGSALVVRGYIQIGILSYGRPGLSKSVTVYTDTGYYYNWIRKYSRKLYCAAEQTSPDTN